MVPLTGFNDVPVRGCSSEEVTGIVGVLTASLDKTTKDDDCKAEVVVGG